MKNFTGLVLENYKSDDLDVHITASIVNGCLHISGQDLGPSVEEFWGDLDYEYYYDFTEKATERLLRLLDGLEDPESALLKNFANSGTSKLSKFCDEHNIPYRFYSYV